LNYLPCCILGVTLRRYELPGIHRKSATSEYFVQQSHHLMNTPVKMNLAPAILPQPDREEPVSPPRRHGERVIQVALATPIPKLFDYYLPSATVEQAEPKLGVRVRVPFGPRQMVGFVAGFGRSSDASIALKTAIKVIDSKPLLPAELWETLNFAARYYHHSLGEVLNTAVPTALRDGSESKARGVPMFRAKAPNLIEKPGSSESSRDVGLAALRGPAQRALLALLLSRDHSDSELNIALPGWRAAFLALKRKDLAEQWTAASFIPPGVALAGPPLNSEQAEAVRAIGAQTGVYAPFLLDGVTGSGKTEVYLQAAAQVLARGQTVLVLVPEIGLTPQTLKRFAQRLAVPQVVAHSQLSDTERAYGWQQARSGAARLVLGTRSAVFAPLPNLGLIVLDEEHDGSYKQLDGFRYHARDLALKRAQTLKIPIVLGSATPSLEILKAASENRIRTLHLRARAAASGLPTQAVLDIRGQSLDEGLSTRAIQAIRECLMSGGQALILRNRRGFAAQLECVTCGHVEHCPRCDRALTLHRAAGALRCHYCDLRQSLRMACSQCASTELTALGVGTERVEIALARLFPEWPIVRVDRDTVSTKGAMEAKLKTLENGKPCILVGTQMLAKGHDLPDIALVLVLGADDGLHAQDFRASERLAQLLLQVAGRAGRASRPGKVLIQTHQPEHPLLQAVIGGDYAPVVQLLMAERRATELPPFAFAALLRADAIKKDALDAYLQAARAQFHQLNPDTTVQIFGPMPAGLAKRAGRYRAQLVLMCSQRAPLHLAILPWIAALHAGKKTGNVHFSLDIDPYEFG
jgi:primosomal protein N' (replication factor Y) (superfamily II helicase)